MTKKKDIRQTYDIGGRRGEEPPEEARLRYKQWRFVKQQLRCCLHGTTFVVLQLLFAFVL